MNDELIVKNMELEESMMSDGVKRFYRENNRSIEKGTVSETNWYSRLTREYVGLVGGVLRNYRKEYGKRKAGRQQIALHYTRGVNHDVLAYIGIKIAFDSIAQKTSLIPMAEAIGKMVQDEVRFHHLEEEAGPYILKVKEAISKSNTTSYKHQRRSLMAAEKKLSSNPENIHIWDWVDWPLGVNSHIGLWILDAIQKSLMFNGEPMFIKRKERKGLGFNRAKEVKNVLELSPNVHEWIEEYKSVMEDTSPIHAPLCIKPKDWTNPYDGGYWSAKIGELTPLVKTNKQHLRLLERQEMPEVYSAVNKLQSVPAKINKDMLYTVDEIHRNKLPMGLQPQDRFKKSNPPIPIGLEHLRGKELKGAMNEFELRKFRKWVEETSDMYRKEKTRGCQAFDESRTILQAKRYADFKEVYFTIALDFRSRVYYNSSLISPQGNDLQKSLIRFANKEPIGPDGQYWLAISGSGLFGYDKTDNADRFDWVIEHYNKILRCANDPSGEHWWLDADKPFQFLSFCQEWRDLDDWIRSGHSSESFQSDYAAFFDASCSGLQHLSAIIGDAKTAAQVNLVNNMKPESVYLYIVDILNERLFSEQSAMADIWKRIGISKPLTKVPVMTIAYDAKRQTFEKATSEYVQEYEDKHGKLFRDKSERFQAINYMAKMMWEVIKKEIRSAKVVMDFIKKVVWQVSKENKPSINITPTGFLVLHEELSTKSCRLTSQMLGQTCFTLRERTKEIDKYKMASSCSANFIHSMDASHLMKVVNAFKYEIFVIHDSFGCHLQHVRELKRCFLTEFNKMYKSNTWLAKFKMYNESMAGREIEVPVPEDMGFDLNNCLSSEYAVN